MAITPTREQFTEFASATREGEVVMINLLHFSKEKEEGTAESTGTDAYREYSDAALKMVKERGGRMVWLGRPEHVVIGDIEADSWDMVALVAYPSRAAFIDMVSSPSYQQAHTHRERGLDRSVLLACEPLLPGAPADA